MSKREEQLMEYEKADANKRLHLYLQFRGLRDDFMEIELKESKYRKFSDPQFLKLFLNLANGCASGAIQTLEDGTKTCALDLTKEVEVLADLSHHISELRKTGLVRIEQRGRQIQFWIEPEVVRDLAKILPPFRPGSCGSKN